MELRTDVTLGIYTLVSSGTWLAGKSKKTWKFIAGKVSINGGCSIAMLDDKRANRININEILM